MAEKVRPPWEDYRAGSPWEDFAAPAAPKKFYRQIPRGKDIGVEEITEEEYLRDQADAMGAAKAAALTTVPLLAGMAAPAGAATGTAALVGRAAASPIGLGATRAVTGMAVGEHPMSAIRAGFEVGGAAGGLKLVGRGLPAVTEKAGEALKRIGERLAPRAAQAAPLAAEAQTVAPVAVGAANVAQEGAKRVGPYFPGDIREFRGAMYEWGPRGGWQKLAGRENARYLELPTPERMSAPVASQAASAASAAPSELEAQLLASLNRLRPPLTGTVQKAAPVASTVTAAPTVRAGIPVDQVEQRVVDWATKGGMSRAQIEATLKEAGYNHERGMVKELVRMIFQKHGITRK